MPKTRPHRLAQSRLPTSRVRRNEERRTKDLEDGKTKEESGKKKMRLARARSMAQEFVRHLSSQGRPPRGGGGRSPSEYQGIPLVGGPKTPLRGGQIPGIIKPGDMQEIPEVPLSSEDQRLRQQLLRQATLMETTFGKNGLIKQAQSGLYAEFKAGAPAEGTDTDAAANAAAASAAVDAAVKSEAISAAAIARKGRETDLMIELRGRLELGGPIPVDEYMNLCLAHPEHGYYMSRDVFGADGDFVTAPELSSIFGELVGVWVVWTWEALGRPEKVQLVELGPGRGTMMSDVMRTVSRFEPLVSSLSVEMVETSPALRELQRKALSRCEIVQGAMLQMTSLTFLLT